MQDLYFTKPESFDLLQMNRELFKVDSIVGENVCIQVIDGLELTQLQKDIIGAGIIEHSPTAPLIETIIITLAEILGCLQDNVTIGTKAEQMILVSTNVPILAILQSLGLREQQIVLNTDCALLVMDTLDSLNLIGSESKVAIKVKLEEKGLVFPE